MSTFMLAWRLLWARPLMAVLNLMLMVLGLAAMGFTLQVSERLERAFERDLAGVDVVVGAKGSPLQIILAGLLHVDVPPGNVPLAEALALASHPQVQTWVPLSLGDSFQGLRIVGTTPDYLTLYGAALAQGRLWDAPMDVVAGAHAARTAGLAVGSRFIGSHGLGPGGHEHGEHPYAVTGVLAPCHCVLDRLLLTSTESVWLVHESDMALDDDDQRALEAERELTLVLIRYRTPLAAITFPRYVNATTTMQAAAPAMEITRLLRVVGVGGEVLRGFATVLLLSAALGVFVALWSAVRERQADLALLRMLGAPAWRVAALVLCEALWLAALASVCGWLLAQGLTALLGWMLQTQGSVALDGALGTWRQLWIPIWALVVALLAAALPTWRAYRTEVAYLLNQRS